jgi:hypothetical protein
MKTTKQDKIKLLCVEALRSNRRYKKIHPEAFQVWACSERKGAASLARKIIRIMKQYED